MVSSCASSPPEPPRYKTWREERAGNLPQLTRRNQVSQAATGAELDQGFDKTCTSIFSAARGFEKHELAFAAENRNRTAREIKDNGLVRGFRNAKEAGMLFGKSCQGFRAVQLA
jgi:hypothetical protein